MLRLDIKQAFYDPGQPVLEDFHLEVAGGEVVAIIGPSGYGKSTILKMVAGLHRGYQGEVNRRAGTRLAFIPQKHCLLPWKTVYGNIVALQRAGGLPVDRHAALELIADLGLEGLENQYPGRLSGGQYQRVALGQAVFYRPDLLLMDEPFSNLDTATKEEMEDLCLRLLQRTGMAALFVTHNLEEAHYMNARIVDLVGP